MNSLKKRAAEFCIVVLTLCACGGDGDDGITITATPDFTTFQEANVVIGQTDFQSADANQGATADANSLNLPNGRVSNGSLYVPDSNNNRVLGFTAIPTANNSIADFVLGQNEFTSTDSGLNDAALSFPSDLWLADGRLFVVDFFNNRVLIWNSLPLSSSPADIVVGQPNFDSSSPGTSANALNGPISVAATEGKLLVTDRDNHRVLIWNQIPTTNGAPADVVVGQPDFNSNVAVLSASGMNRPRSVWSDGQRLAVSDASNHRVLIWNSIPVTNGQPADLVIGQPDFNSADEGTGADQLNNPRAVFFNDGQFFIADRDNNRVLIFNSFPDANQSAADIVLGQRNFENNSANDDDQNGVEDSTPSARTFSGPTGVFATDDQLFVTDRGNNRVLIFDKR